MGDWTEPTGFQLKALRDALQFAYPRPSLFADFLRLKLNQVYAAIAPAGEPYDHALLAILTDRAMAEGWLPDLVARALQDKPNSPKLKLLDRTLTLTAVEVPSTLGTLEDIVRPTQPSLDVFPWIDKLEKLAGRVCRIENPVGQGWGTGCLVAPNLVLTNWHVVRRALPGNDWQAKDFICRFDYAVRNGATDAGREVRLADDWLEAVSPASASELGNGTATPTPATLDYALLRLESHIGDEPAPGGNKRGWIEISRKSTPSPDLIFVVQHPAGYPMKLAVGRYRGDVDAGLRFQHDANTTSGSSGSPVVEAALVPIGLHHAGDLLYHQTRLGNPELNQAIPLARIVQDLDQKQVTKFWEE